MDSQASAACPHCKTMQIWTYVKEGVSGGNMVPFRVKPSIGNRHEEYNEQSGYLCIAKPFILTLWDTLT